MAKRAKATKNEIEDDNKALDALLGVIRKNYGNSSIMLMDEKNVIADVDVIPSGLIGLDHALGVGGYPRGRVIEIFGHEATGKTMLLLSAIAQAQKLKQKPKKQVMIIDAEHALDIPWAQKLGVDTSDLLISQPDYGEQGLSILEDCVASGIYSIIGVDSVASLVPKAELEGEIGDSHMGLQARMMSQTLRMLTPIVSKTNTTVIFINQVRQKIGQFFGTPETTTGGNALKFYASVRLDVRRRQALKHDKDIYGATTSVTVVKNKVAPPFKSCLFDVIYADGIDHVGEVLDYAVTYGIVEKTGAWYSYGDERVGQGQENAKDFLRDAPKMFEEIKAKVLERMK